MESSSTPPVSPTTSIPNLPSQASPNPKKRKRKKYDSLDQILDEFGDATAVHFDPFQPEPHQEAQAKLPQDFPPNPTPFDYFSLFFTPDIIHIITNNTNRYAARQRSQDDEGRKWEDLLAPELYVLLGAIIYIGVHEEPQISQYWNTDLDIGPIHTLLLHLV
jgi:hypothetical protein